LGVVKGSYERAQPEVRANFERSVTILSKFANVTHDVEFPDYPYSEMLRTILYSEGASAFRELIDKGQMREMRNQADRIGGYLGMMVSAVDYLQAQRVRKLARLAIDELLAKYDALVGPTEWEVSGRVGEPFDRTTSRSAKQRELEARGPELVPAGNLAGVPAITVPNGFGQNNLPTGLQFLGAAWSERTLVAIADAYQRATDWHKRRPPAVV
jgi:aspartyl-tRNA(Asn)/glutamyl-tRNA(Gln) amidotransferase subunit A